MAGAVFPITAFAAVDYAEIAHSFNPFQIFCSLVPQLPLGTQTQRCPVGTLLRWNYGDRWYDHVVTVAPALERVGGFGAFLGEAFDEDAAYAALRKAETLGRPIGSPQWLEDMEARFGLKLLPGKRGPRSRVI